MTRPGRKNKPDTQSYKLQIGIRVTSVEAPHFRGVIVARKKRGEHKFYTIKIDGGEMEAHEEKILIPEVLIPKTI